MKHLAAPLLLVQSLLLMACADDAAPLADVGLDVASKADVGRQNDLLLADAGARDLMRDGQIVLREASVDSTVDTLFVCNPPAASGSFYQLSANTTLREISMCEYRDRVLLVVNIAAK